MGALSSGRLLPTFYGIDSVHLRFRVYIYNYGEDGMFFNSESDPV